MIEKEKLLKDISKTPVSLVDLSNIYECSMKEVIKVLDDCIKEGLNIIEGPVNHFYFAKKVVPQENKYTEKWNNQRIIKFGGISDTHLCNKWQQLTFLNYLYDIYEYEGITTVYHCGDLADGYYKNRPGHIYELIPGMIGADQQADYIIDKYPYRKGITTKFITGNHDHTHILNGGADIGKQIHRDREDMEYLGQNNAKIEITPNCRLELNHPMDGSSYALSYSLQKLIDSMSGGEKPNILLNGHHHKSFMMPVYRNIHAFEMGTTEAQTPYMKGQKIAAHIGGWIIEVHVDTDGTVERVKGEFIACFKPKENDY